MPPTSKATLTHPSNLQNITLPEPQLLQFCQHWQITRLALSGSVLRPDFNPKTSDIDILVDFDEAARHTLLDFVEMQDQLIEIFDRKVDLISRKGVEDSRNSERKREILSSAQTIFYASSSSTGMLNPDNTF